RLGRGLMLQPLGLSRPFLLWGFLVLQSLDRLVRKILLLSFKIIYKTLRASSTLAFSFTILEIAWIIFFGSLYCQMFLPILVPIAPASMTCLTNSKTSRPVFILAPPAAITGTSEYFTIFL